MTVDSPLVIFLDGVNASGKTAKKKKVQAKHPLPTTAKSSNGAASKGVEAACKKILEGLVELNVFATSAHDKQRVAFAAGYKNTTTKTFRSAIVQLRDNGDIECQPGQKILLTEQGRAKVGPEKSTPKTNADMQAHIVQMIKVPGYKQGCGKFVESLKDGSAKTRMEVANDMGFSRIDSHGFRNCLKSLKEQGMVETVKDNSSKQTFIRLSDLAFPQGRPCDAL